VSRDLEPFRADRGRGDFNRYFAEDYQLLLAFLIKQGAEPPEAHDAAQFAMIQLYPRWESVRSPRAYVRKVAERSYLKSSARAADEPKRMVLGGFAFEEVTMSPLDKVIFDEEQRELIRMLQMLPPVQRRVMAWHLDGFSNLEIAEAFGKTPGSVAASLSEARKKLRALWAERQRLSQAVGGRADDERQGR
jgi:RNA polymerase sigma factor (sigma-70 family)